MSRTVKDLMSPHVVGVAAMSPVVTAARAMRDNNIGDVLVLDGSTVIGVVTDRDLAVRVLADGRDPNATLVNEVTNGDLVATAVDTPVEDAMRVMRRHAVRRLPVVDRSGTAVRMVSLGDLAAHDQARPALAEISDAPPNV